MHLLRLTTYLINVLIFGAAGNFVLSFPANFQVNFSSNQVLAKQYRKMQGLERIVFSEIPTPYVNFPEEIFPEVKFSEITCSKIRVQENKDLTIITLPVDILFVSGKDQVRPKADKVLTQVSQFITNHYPHTWLQVLGHTDSVGSEGDNLKLSEQQALAVQSWLSQKGGIDISLITKQGYGETQPIAPNNNSDGSDNPVGRRNNRRIEIVIQKKADHV
ncbi:OmpA family protein [Fischerella sp. JS2]|uniref:OmpA family protein n=1 Tax=Fischerella sp. JS2 TaxID=2597771 RepID=UPI0028E313EA|nr:OmpA family protein [Fischerella sp. JS2]